MRLQPHKALLLESGLGGYGATDASASAAAIDKGEAATEREIDIHLVQPGDVLRVLPGAQVPYSPIQGAVSVLVARWNCCNSKPGQPMNEHMS